jgi:hypothetical protein
LGWVFYIVLIFFLDIEFKELIFCNMYVCSLCVGVCHNKGFYLCSYVCTPFLILSGLIKGVIFREVT